jgi:hypothetical protein
MRILREEQSIAHRVGSPALFLTNWKPTDLPTNGSLMLVQAFFAPRPSRAEVLIESIQPLHHPATDQGIVKTSYVVDRHGSLCFNLFALGSISVRMLGA